MRILAKLLAVTLTVHAYAQTGPTRGYLISGYVVDEQSKPLANMTVRLNRVAMGQYFLAKTDNRGNYSHAGLPGGEYELSVVKDGHSFVLDTRIGVEDRFISGDNAVQTNLIRQVSTVNFDLRNLAGHYAQQPQQITLAGLKIPRKAQDEFKKAFDAKDDVEAAKRHLENAISLAPNYEAALNNLGTIYGRSQQYAEAAALFERAVAANPKSIVARLNLAATRTLASDAF